MTSPSLPTPPVTSNGASVGLSILIVDDNVDAAESLGMLLSFEGHQVTVVHSGAEALEAGARVLPDVAFVDIGMPLMDGYQLARTVRALPWGANVLLIASTGWGQEDDKRRASEAGFDRHITKPADPLSLVTAITQWQADRQGAAPAA